MLDNVQSILPEHDCEFCGMMFHSDIERDTHEMLGHLTKQVRKKKFNMNYHLL